MKGLIITILSFLLVSGCQMKSVLLQPAHQRGGDEGEVFLYTRPFPQEADRLRFHIEEIFAEREDGTVYPLLSAVNEIKSLDMKRQRLIASGVLPEGRYTGFLYKISEASLQTEEGEANLLVPEGPVKAEFLFDVKREKSYVIWLDFIYAKSIINRIGFSPSFSIFFPKKPVVSLLGYVTNFDSDNLTVFDKKSMQVTGVIATRKGPAGIALDQQRKRAYVTLADDDSVEVIDITSGEKINSIRLNPGDRPGEAVLTRTGTLLLTVNKGSDSISIIDPIAFIELHRVPVGNGPHSAVVDSAGRRAYVFNTLSGTISVIDLSNRTVAATVSTEPGPLRGQFNREGDTLYVMHEWSSYITMLDPFNLSTRGRIRVGIGASALKLDSRSNLIYLGKKDDTLVEVYDPFSMVPVDYLSGAGPASYITIDGEENNLYLVVPEMEEVMVVDIVSKKIVSRIDVGKNPGRVTMMGER